MRDIKGYEGIYAITRSGRIWAYKRKIEKKSRWGRLISYGWGGYWLKSNTTKNGDWYMSISFGNSQDPNRRGFKVHRLVAQAFIPNPLNLPEVNHKNGDKLDNRVENLEWCTRKENLEHGFKIKPSSQRNYLRGENGTWAKLTQKQANEIREKYKKKKSRYSTDVSTRKLAKEYNVSFPTIGDIVRNKRYI